MKKVYLSLICVATLVLVTECVSHSQTQSVPVKTSNDITQIASVVEQDTFPSDLETFQDSVYWKIIDLNIEHPDIAYAQVLLETGHFSSEVFNQNNNLFGMKYPGSRKTKAIGTNLNHAVFDTWEDSIEDYKIWQQKYASGKSRKEYFAYLNECYSANDEYSSLLKDIIKSQNLQKQMKLLAQK